MTSDSAAMPPAQSSPEQTKTPQPAPDVATPLSAPEYSTPCEVDLAQLTSAKTALIALDFDGVLAPLQDNPELSRMLPESAQAIAALSVLPGIRVALVSGRDITTLRQLADPPEHVWLVGSHGAEVDLGSSFEPETPAPGSESPATRPEVTAREQGMLDAIDAHIDSFAHDMHPDTASVAGTPGAVSATGTPDSASEFGAAVEVRVERKPFSRTVHTRGLDTEFASTLHSHVVAVQSEHPGIRVIEGHDITELAVKTATKGDGLRALVTAGSPSTVLYMGDDITDEDAFAEIEGLPSNIAIKVGPAQTRATWRITDPTAVARLLDRIAAERRTHANRA